MSLAPASRPEELDPAWLTAALGRPVTAVSCDRVGTGQIGECYRLRLTGDGVPASVLAKLPAEESSARELLAGAYRSEHRFYSQLAATVDVRVPDCHFAVIDPATGEFTLLLQDLATYQQGDQLGGCTVDQARDAVENLAGLHGPRWCDPTLLDVDGLSLNGPADASLLQELYVPATETFLEALGDRVLGEDAETLRACAQVSEAWALGRAERFALCHGDYRLDNVMFPSIGTGSVALDWQTLSLALPARDLAFFLGTSLAVETRRAAERALVADYHSALRSHGVTTYDAQHCWEDYRFAMLQGPLIAVFGCVYGTRTERGDAMFAAMVSRSCAAIRDLGTLELV